ncbi:MAG: hypothetical protein ACE37B_09710 [Ilumatobacter sp.]|jgi:hypothetical protein|uniref:hypothetical protein n=1 Tax=Ilumatobacter sp. TaxID=1967498 RepID=UPI0039191340
MSYLTDGAIASTTTPTDRPDDASSAHVPTPTWMPWAGSRRPATTREEAAFRASLDALAGTGTAEVRRRDITAVLNALRCGLTVDQLLERAPGLDATRLRAAYDHLDALRVDAADAWRDIVADPTPDVFDLRAPVAGTMLPRLVFVLEGIAQSSPFEFADVVGQLDEAVRAADDAATAVEARLATVGDDRDEAILVGRLLYDPDGSGIANWPTYCPRRVGTLSPARVAALLGERAEGTQLTSVRAPRTL